VSGEVFTWESLAVASRNALRLLGYDGPDCLPGEPGACGGTFYEHAVAHLGALQAVVDHHLTHVSAPDALAMAEDVRWKTAADLMPCPNPFHGQRNSGGDL
jgi:hypothetical protein